jgi:predicted dehydrogenase
MITFGIIGAGWRTEFFLRIAQALPDRLSVAGVVVRNPEKAERFAQQWNVRTFATPEEMFAATNPALVVVSVPWNVSVEMLLKCADRGIPALGETPPAPDIAGLVTLTQQVKAGAKIQVAEQYFAQPLHAARLAVVASGKIGTPSQAQVSVAHGYHGISLMRKYLGIGFENGLITATKIVSPLANSPGRNGPPATEKIVESAQVIARFDFENGKTGIYDFTGDQYFSYIRGPRLLVRGERGEIEGETVRYLLDSATGVSVPLLRNDTGHLGNLEGYCHRGYTLGGEYVYRNPFPPARLADDEIAIAAALEGTARYAEGEQDFYSLADAAQDRYLDICVEEAVRTGKPIQTTSQLWAS